jgi:hypothetical protein
VLENAVRHAQPAHVRVLVGRDVKKTKKPPAKIVGGLGVFVFRRLLFQLFVAVKGMQLALEFLLVRELFAFREHAVLGTDMRRVRTRRLGNSARRSFIRDGGSAASRARDLQAGGEAFEIPLLLG